MKTKSGGGNGYGNFKGPITFDKLVINLGEGFDMGSGTFVVPTSGTYRLSFSAISGNENQYTNVYVKKNGKNILRIHDGNREDTANNLSYTWMVVLNRGDRVELYTSNYLFADFEIPVTFTGELIHI